MTKATIDNPIINSPFVEPTQHFLTSPDGEVTGEIDPRRRPSEFFVPVARPRKVSGQLTIDAFGGPKRQQPNEIVNEIRQSVARWRLQNYPHITAVERCLLMTTDPGDLVLDPTCGSGTTAYVAEQWGRRWITIDTSRVALALARSRLMAAKYPWYLLADSEAGIRKEAELTGQTPPSPLPTDRQRCPPRLRVRARAARDPEVDRPEPGHPRGHEREEIDAAIARHAETETLFDRPYEDRKVVRVSGPFTVESLSPHRVMVDGPEDVAAAETVPSVDAGALRRRASSTTSAAPASRTRSAPSGSSSPGSTRTRASASRGSGSTARTGPRRPSRSRSGPSSAPSAPSSSATPPRRPSSSPTCSSCAASRSTRWRGRRPRRLGRLTILQARMNPDLAMGDELLKKTGTGNLFMVFGEPDIDVRAAGEGQIEVEVRGLDVYDPTTGVLRSSSVDDIAAWFLDTNYDGDAFFVRHAYFTGADDPYDKLRRALRADISDEAWATVNSSVSRPFPRPTTGKVAVKVINHYGDEVMKVLTAQ